MDDEDNELTPALGSQHEEGTHPVPPVNRVSPAMRRVLVIILFVVLLQLVVLVYIFDLDFKQVHHAASSWSQVFGGTTEEPNQEIGTITFPPSIDTSLNETMFVRAAVLYLPTGAVQSKFEREFRWFRRSWIEMKKNEPLNWRTDIVVYSNGPLPLLEQLGCGVNKPRTTREEPNRCVLYTDYISLYTNSFPYRFADSVNVLALNTTALDIYDWVLRTDIDTFLTRAFSTWHPATMIVGKGAYSFPGNPTGDRLDEIAKRLNLTSMTINNVGSTWYGPTTLVRTCANLSVSLMQYMYANEFTDEERSVEYGIKGWPKWHIGVVSMYAGHIAINHCTRDVGVVKDETMLDFPTTSNESPSKHAHLHTWQNSERFSKFEFAAGNYKDENKTVLDLDKISDYAMYMALDSQPT